MGLALWWNSRRLRSDLPQVRALAIARLGNLGQPAAVGLLGDALRDPEPGLRTAVAQALGALGHVDAVGPLVAALLAEQHWDVRYEIVSALRKIGDPKAVNELLVILDDRNASIGLQQVTTWALKEFGWEHLTPTQQASVLILREEWSEVRKIGAEAVAPVLAAIKEGTPRMRQEAATTLAHIGGERGRERGTAGLLELLASSDRDLQRVAAGVLDKAGQGIASSSLPSSLPSSSSSSSPSALSPEQSARVAIILERWSAIPSLGEAAVPALAKIIRADNPETAPRAAHAMGEIGGSRAQQTLSDALRHKLSNVRVAAAKALARCGDADSLPALQMALDDVDPSVRETVADTLATLGWSPEEPSEQVRFALAAGSSTGLVVMGTPAIAPLIESLTHPMVRHLASETLAQIGEPTIEPLVQALQDQRATLRVAVADTLGRIASKVCIAALKQALDDPELDVRKAAHNALLKTGWQAVDETESVRVAIALGAWSDVVAFGPLAMALLLERVDDPRSASAILRTIDKILQGSSARNLSIIDLQTIANLATTNASGNVRPGAANSAALQTTVARRRIAQLARHELKRRQQPVA